MIRQPSVACECEHIAHFTKDHTPNGNPGHRYHSRFSPRFTQEVKTPYGTFTMCRDCATDCAHAYFREA